MSVLFEPIKINRMEVCNRFARSATNDGGADEDGFVRDRQVTLYEELAAGGVGLIVSGATNVQKQGQILPYQWRITSDEHCRGLSKAAEAAHRHGAKVAVQLFHGGAEAGTYGASRGFTAKAPSRLSGDDPFFPFFKSEYGVLTSGDIEEIIRDFGKGARRVREAGCDAVQLHGAHGYLFSQFLSPYINRRTDEWGGSLENRQRFILETYREIRLQVGPDFPVMIKLGVQDSFEAGLKFDEGARTAGSLDDAGFDALEISSGARGPGWNKTEFKTGIRETADEAYYRLWSREIRPLVKSPLILAGGLRSFELMEKIVAASDADIVAMSRPLIRQPGLINRWRQGDRTRSECISCNQCVQALVEGRMALCGQLDKGA
ncbi:MAG: NADH:flavin oxidoreductase [Proteobacteria bacterium]|nr:NADH:flavin oxidoreductase [Pseudomonadota bacterium]